MWKAWGVGSERDASQPQFINHTGLVYGITGSGKRLTIYASSFQPRGNRPRRTAAGRSLRAAPMGRRAAIVAAGLSVVAAIVVAAVFGLASKRAHRPRGAGAAARNARAARHHAREPARGSGRAPVAGRLLGQLVRPLRGTRRRRSSASAAAPPAAGGSSASTGATPLTGDARAFVRRYCVDVPDPARRGRDRRQRLSSERPAEHVRDRRPRTHPRGPARAAERELAGRGARARGTQLRRRRGYVGLLPAEVRRSAIPHAPSAAPAASGPNAG